MSSFRKEPTTPQRPSVLSIERVVAILTPVFTAAGGAISTGIGSAVGIPAKDFTDLFIAGAAPALGAAITWLLGRQKFVKAEADVQAMVEKAYRSVMSDQKAGPAIEDIAKLLEAQGGTIIHALVGKMGAPASAEEIAQQMLDQAERRQQAATRATQALSGLAAGGASGGGGPSPAVAASETPGVTGS